MKSTSRAWQSCVACLKPSTSAQPHATRWLSRPMLTPRLPRVHQIMVKKAGEPCTLYSKGRILGYKR